MRSSPRAACLLRRRRHVPSFMMAVSLSPGVLTLMRGRAAIPTRSRCRLSRSVRRMCRTYLLGRHRLPAVVRGRAWTAAALHRLSRLAPLGCGGVVRRPLAARSLHARSRRPGSRRTRRISQAPSTVLLFSPVPPRTKSLSIWTGMSCTDTLWGARPLQDGHQRLLVTRHRRISYPTRLTVSHIR